VQYFNRKQARDHIRQKGIPIGDNFLPQQASAGTGPEYQYSGRYPIYREDKLDAWIEARLSAPVRSPLEAGKGRNESAPIDEPALGPLTRTSRRRPGRPRKQPAATSTAPSPPP
jgi:hypothetical protein